MGTPTHRWLSIAVRVRRSLDHTSVVSLNAMQVSLSLGIGALGGGGTGKLEGGILEGGRVDALGDDRLHFAIRSISNLMVSSVSMLTEVFLPELCSNDSPVAAALPFQPVTIWYAP